MRICFATYPAMMMLKGGPRTQILRTKCELEKCGVEVELFDPWKEFDAARYDLVHLFAANIGTYHLAHTMHLNGIPFVVSPIFFTRRSFASVRSALQIGHVLKKLLPGSQFELNVREDVCRWARGVLPNTSAEAQLFAEGLGVPTEKIHLVPNGVEKRFANATAAAFKKKFGLDKFVLYAGHIGPKRKNVLRLLEALDDIDVPAVLIARIEGSPEAKRCLDLAKSNPRVTILESLPHDSPLLASAYAASDVFVLPSQFETPGLAALEAATAGAKIVITPHGGTKDYFADHAEYVNPYSVESIRNGIINALTKADTNELRERLLREFTWRHVAQKTKAVYEKILGT